MISELPDQDFSVPEGAMITVNLKTSGSSKPKSEASASQHANAAGSKVFALEPPPPKGSKQDERKKEMAIWLGMLVTTQGRN